MSIHLGDVPTWIAALGGTGAATAALRQLGLQGRQLANQQQTIQAESERNRSRDELLQRQLRDFDQRARTWERRQAEKVTVDFASSARPPCGITVNEGDRVFAAHVVNDSDRPIRDVTAAIVINHGEEPQPASTCHRLSPTTDPDTGVYGIVETVENCFIDLMTIDDRTEFVFPYSTSIASAVVLVVHRRRRLKLAGRPEPAPTTSPTPAPDPTVRHSGSRPAHWQLVTTIAS